MKKRKKDDDDGSTSDTANVGSSMVATTSSKSKVAGKSGATKHVTTSVKSRAAQSGLKKSSGAMDAASLLLGLGAGSVSKKQGVVGRGVAKKALLKTQAQKFTSKARASKGGKLPSGTPTSKSAAPA